MSISLLVQKQMTVLRLEPPAVFKKGMVVCFITGASFSDGDFYTSRAPNKTE